MDVALGHLSLMLARRGRDVLRRAGIEAELFRDDDLFERAQSVYTGAAGLAYLRAASFDPDAFGLYVDTDRAADAVRALAQAGLRVSILEPAEGEVIPARSIPPGDPTEHPYRGESEERVCLRCGEPDHGARPQGAGCARCGGILAPHAEWLARKRRTTRRWAAFFVLALLALGIASPRIATCGSAAHSVP